MRSVVTFRGVDGELTHLTSVERPGAAIDGRAVFPRYLLEGTTYFISAWNEQNEEVRQAPKSSRHPSPLAALLVLTAYACVDAVQRSILENRKRNAEMLMEISVMYPQPTLVFDA